MFNEEIVKALSELAALTNGASTNTEFYLKSQESLAAALPCTNEELIDIIYDYENSDIVVEALEVFSLNRDPKCKVVLTDIMNAHPEVKVSERARQLLFSVITIETAKEFLKSKK
jgi:hypothetical protein